MSTWKFWQNNLKAYKMLSWHVSAGLMVREEAIMDVRCTTWNVTFPDWVHLYTHNCNSCWRRPLLSFPTVQLIFHELLGNLKQMKLPWHHLALCHEILFVQSGLIIFYIFFPLYNVAALGALLYIYSILYQYCTNPILLKKLSKIKK